MNQLSYKKELGIEFNLSEIKPIGYKLIKPFEN